MTHGNPLDRQITAARLRIGSIDNRDSATATAINCIQLAAYQQEGDLLDIHDFPPLRQTARDVQQSQASFIGAFWDAQLAGIICTEAQAAETRITSLTIAPAYQRLGIARALVGHAARLSRSQHLHVSTSSRNAPGIALYRALGFEVYQLRHVSPERVEITDLVIKRERLLPDGAH